MFLKYSLLGFFLLFVKIGMGQPAHLLNNPDIVWLVESFALCTVDENQTNLSTNYAASITVPLKYIHQEAFNDFRQSSAAHHSLKQKIVDLLKQEETVFYASHQLKNPLSGKAILKWKLKDTINSFDPDNVEAIQQIVQNQLKREDIYYFMIKHWLCYNNKTKQFEILPVALAPMTQHKRKIQALFWLPINTTAKIALEDRNLNWIVRTSYNLFMRDADVWKEEIEFEKIWDELYADIKDTTIQQDYYHIALPRTDYFNFYQLPNKERAAITNHVIDSVITFDPDTFKEVVQVFDYEVKYSFFEGIKVYQDWAWDDKKQQLLIQQRLYAPIYSKSILNGKIEESRVPYPYIFKKHQ